MKNMKLKLLVASMGAAAATAPMISTAQMLEEVVVTATKRSTGLQDVPIAMSVMSGEKISQFGMSDLGDISSSLPNVHVGQAVGADQLFIRGVGSGPNFGFEQSVGMFIDGVYYGRGRNSRFSFLDVERVEVLKGPQATLFGKNTIAGAISITSAKPTDEFEAYVQATAETETHGTGITGMVSGPISDSLAGRLIVKKYEDDGYVKNTYIGEDGPQQDSWVARGTLIWDATDNLSITLKAESGEFDVTGRQQLISKASDTAIALYQTADPNFQPGFEYERSVANPSGPNGREGEYDHTNSEIYQLDIDYQWGGHSIRSTTAFTEYDFFMYKDADYGPLEVTPQIRDEQHKQFSQEFLLTSPVGGAVEYLAGLYYQSAELVHHEEVDVSLSNLVAAGLPLPPYDASTNHTFTQDSKSWSSFTQLTWHITEDFRTIFGVRYSYDEKEMTNVTFVGEFQNPTESDPFLCAVYGNALNFIKCATFNENTPNFDPKREESHVTGNITFQYDVSPEIMSYLTLSNGYKGGGYDESNRMASVDNAEFEDETVESIELGAKMDLYSGKMRLNLATFYSQYDDVQVSTFDGNSSFVVGNASETEVQGIEADMQFALTDEITLSGAIAYLDAQYKSFSDAACNAQQAAEWSGEGTCLQDLSGKPLQFAPEISANLGFDYVTSITSDLNLQIAANANYMDEFSVANDLDDHLIVESFWKFDARVALYSSDNKWMIALVGKNLSDEKTFNWGNDVPFSSLGFAFTYFKNIEPPRTFELQARYEF